VISTREVEEAEESDTTSAVITSVPVSVVNVNVSVDVAEVPGPMMMEDGSVVVEVSRIVVAEKTLWEEDRLQTAKKTMRNFFAERPLR
jgi:hypothetical protein